MTKTLDITGWLLQKGRDGYWRYCSHEHRMITAGFASRKGAVQGRAGFFDNEGSRVLMKRRYEQEYGEHPVQWCAQCKKYHSEQAGHTNPFSPASAHFVPEQRETPVVQSPATFDAAYADAQRKIVEILRRFQLPDDEDASSMRDQHVRSIVKGALRELGVYDAGGCPLCLS
jgi:hypothetical protein